MNDDTITTRTVGRGLADVEQEFVLDDKPQTKTVFKAQIHDNGIRGWIYRYKKNSNGDNEEIIPADFRQLHANEGVRIELPTAGVATLHQRFGELSRLLEEQGVLYGEHTFTITDANALVITDENKAAIIGKLLDDNLGEEVWAQLAESNPDIATRLANAQLQTDRTEVVRQFEEMLANDTLTEDSWQNFFEKNTWIFGYGLRYQILNVEQTQPTYGGAHVTGRGGQRGDFLMATEAETKFTCLVEIKRPNTPLLQTVEYRNGVWGVSNEFAGAVSQIQVNCARWEIEGARTEGNRELMRNIRTIAPKGIVVIGNTSQLDTYDKCNSFERYRNTMHNPEIITYDELYQRAKFIIDETALSLEQEQEELPF